jgi:hypothetical protein
MRSSGTGGSGYKRIAIALIAAFALLLLAACGGSSGNGSGSSSGNMPVFSGAEKLDSEKMSADDMADMGFKASNGEAAVYKSDKSFKEVSDYYATGIKSNGWNVVMAMPFGETSFAILSKDKNVLVATVMSGKEAKSDSGMFDADELDVDLNDIQDDETLIVLASFVCDEDDISVCTNLGS